MPKRWMPCVLAWMLAQHAYAGTGTGNKDWHVPAGNGVFAAAARNLCKTSPPEVADAAVWSPDRRQKIVLRVTADGDTATFAIDGDGRETPIDTAAWPCPEVAWAADSTLFFINYSEGGAVGTYGVAAYRIGAGKTEKIDIASAVRRDFGRRYPKCFSPETPNVAGVAWSASGTRVMVAAEVLPHANCDNMGTFNLYEVAVPEGRIVRRIPQLPAKASFGYMLGPELRAAEDRCFSRPGFCTIPALHAPSMARQR